MNRQHTSLEEQKVDKKLFGMRINKARKDRGLTAEKLAEACNINSTYLRQIEGGKKLPSLPVFATLCRELRVSPNYILPDLVEGTEAEKFKKFFLSPIRRRPRSRCLRRWLGSF
jgi:transcriptional regulator with XRE-family HTH domain